MSGDVCQNGLCHFGSRLTVDRGSFKISPARPNPWWLMSPWRNPLWRSLMLTLTSLRSSVATLFARKQIPYSVQAAIAKDGYITLEDIADRWDDPAAARTNGPRVLGFDPGNNGFTEQSSAFTAMRLFQAIKAAKDMTKNIYAPRSCVTPGHSWPARITEETLRARDSLDRSRPRYPQGGLASPRHPAWPGPVQHGNAPIHESICLCPRFGGPDSLQ